MHFSIITTKHSNNICPASHPSRMYYLGLQKISEGDNKTKQNKTRLSNKNNRARNYIKILLFFKAAMNWEEVSIYRGK